MMESIVELGRLKRLGILAKPIRALNLPAQYGFDERCKRPIRPLLLAFRQSVPNPLDVGRVRRSSADLNV